MNISDESVCGLLLILGSLASQAAPPTTGASEPGEVESRHRVTTAPRPTTFSSPQTEARGIWLASRDLVLPREEMLKRLDQLQQANFNIVLIDTYYRGYVAYPGSEHLAQDPALKGDDVLGWLIDECHKRGMQA